VRDSLRALRLCGAWWIVLDGFGLTRRRLVAVRTCHGDVAESVLAELLETIAAAELEPVIA
jgi:hypothetical protein